MRSTAIAGFAYLQHIAATLLTSDNQLQQLMTCINLSPHEIRQLTITSVNTVRKGLNGSLNAAEEQRLVESMCMLHAHCTNAAAHTAYVY